MPNFRCSRCGLNEIEAQVAGCEEGPCPMVYVGPMRFDTGVLTCAFIFALALCGGVIGVCLVKAFQ